MNRKLLQLIALCLINAVGIVNAVKRKRLEQEDLIVKRPRMMKNVSDDKVKELIKKYIVQKNNVDNFLEDNFFINDNQVWAYEAYINNNLKKFQSILKENIINKLDIFGAIKNNDLEAVKLILLSMDNLDTIKLKDSNTPLLMAVKEGKKDIVELLLKFGANVNIKNRDGLFPLAIATYNNLDDIVELLLENGANVNDQEVDGDTPLMIASDEEYENISRILLEFNAGVNIANKLEETALIKAVENNNLPIVKLLVENGAFLDSETHEGETAFTVAQTNDYEDIEDFINQIYDAELNLATVFGVDKVADQQLVDRWFNRQPQDIKQTLVNRWINQYKRSLSKKDIEAFILNLKPYLNASSRVRLSKIIPSDMRDAKIYDIDIKTKK